MSRLTSVSVVNGREVQKNKDGSENRDINVEFPESCVYCSKESNSTVDRKIVTVFKEDEKKITNSVFLKIPYCSDHLDLLGNIENRRNKIAKAFLLTDLVLLVPLVILGYREWKIDGGDLGEMIVGGIILVFLIFGLSSAIIGIIHIIMNIINSDWANYWEESSGTLGVKITLPTDNSFITFEFSNSQYAQEFKNKNRNFLYN